MRCEDRYRRVPGLKELFLCWSTCKWQVCSELSTLLRSALTARVNIALVMCGVQAGREMLRLTAQEPSRHIAATLERNAGNTEAHECGMAGARTIAMRALLATRACDFRTVFPHTVSPPQLSLKLAISVPRQKFDEQSSESDDKRLAGTAQGLGQ